MSRLVLNKRTCLLIAVKPVFGSVHLIVGAGRSVRLDSKLVLDRHIAPPCLPDASIHTIRRLSSDVDISTETRSQDLGSAQNMEDTSTPYRNTSGSKQSVLIRPENETCSW